MVIDYDARVSRPTTPDVRLLAALADPVRLEILRELSGASEICACDFTDCCTVSQPTVSHHLKVLREAGAVVSERRGSSIYYRISPDLTDRLGTIARGFIPGTFVPASALTRRSVADAAASEVPTAS